MKKVLSLIAVAAMSTAFVACGPSKEEMEKREKFKLDSIASADKIRQDSAAAAQAEMDRIAAENNAKRIADSTHVADSIANAGKKHKK